MKNLLKTTLLSAAIFAATQSYAQEHHDHAPVGQKIGGAAKDVGHATATAAKDVGHATGHAAVSVGHKTAELSAKGAAAITDKKVDKRWGPRGEVVYYDTHSRYFYVDKRGHRNYVAWSHLRRNKPSY